MPSETTPLTAAELAEAQRLLTLIPAGPYQVYEDYEDRLHLLAGDTRTVLGDEYAYDGDAEVSERRMEATASLLTLVPRLLATVQALTEERHAFYRDSRKDYLDVADALLPESGGPADLVAEVKRLRDAERRLADQRDDAERRANDFEIALAERDAEVRRLTEERDAARDCGQDGVCAIAPGCVRHFAERNRELVAARDEAVKIGLEALAAREQDIHYRSGLVHKAWDERNAAQAERDSLAAQLAERDAQIAHLVGGPWVALSADLVAAIERYVADKDPDPSKMRGLNAVAYIGERVIAIYGANKAARSGDGVEVYFRMPDGDHASARIPRALLASWVARTEVKP